MERGRSRLTKKRITPFHGSIEEFYNEKLFLVMSRESFERAIIESTYHKDPLPIRLSTTDITECLDRLQLFNNHK